MTDALKTGISREEVEKSLNHNPTWTLMPLCANGVDQEAAAKAWSAMKAVMLNTIVKTLRVCEEQNGHDHMIATWAIIQRQLTSRYDMNWHAPCNLNAVWMNKYKKASMKAQQDNPKQVGRALKGSFADEMLATIRRDIGRAS